MALITTEHFTRALAVTHMQEEHVAQQDRMEAEQYLMCLRASPEGLNLAFHIISNEDFSDIRCFWAFNTIIHHLSDLSQSVSAEQAMLVYNTLFSWLLRHCQSTVLPDFILNKHAQTMVVGIQEFYPSRWPTVFDDLFALLQRREAWSHARDHLTLYFLRVFEYIDERVVCVRSQSDRTRDQRQRDMEVKDTMRELVIINAVSAWFQVLCEYRSRTPEIARVCLDVVQAYVEWIDIHLMITSEWMHLLYFFTTVPFLRQAGCDCLYNIVVKKQLPTVKVETIRSMGIVDALPRIVLLVPTPSTEEEETFLLGVVTLANGVAEQLLPCTETSIPGAAELFHPVVTEVLRLFSIAHFQVREISLPFIQQFVKSNVMGDNEVGELLHLIYRHTIIANRDDWLQPSDELIDQRKVLHNLIRLLHRRFPSIVLDHCSRVAFQVVSVASSAELPNSEAEGAMRYLYELGETIKMDAVLKDASSPIAQIVFHMLHCPFITGHHDSFVHLAYFELMDRYSAFFVHHRDQVPVVLHQLLLMPCGIVNPNDRVRSRICYLFGHMLQTLKVQFAPHAEHIVKAVDNIFATRSNILPSDKLDLYEGMGTMLSVSDPTMCVAVAESVVHHMQRLCEEHSRAPTGDADALAAQVADDIAFLSHLAKGIAGSDATKIPDSPPLTSKDPQGSASNQHFPSTLPQLSDTSSLTQPPMQTFWQVTLDVMGTLDMWSGSALVRDRTCLFMHQMVNILSHHTLGDVFEVFVGRMLQWAVGPSELPKVLRVVYQFVNRTRVSSVAIMARILPQLHQRVVHMCCDVALVRSEMGVVSEYVKEHADAYRNYFSVLHAVVHCSCLPALFTEPALATVSAVLQLLVGAVRVSAEFELPKQSLQIIGRLAAQLCGEQTACGEALTAFLLQIAVPEILDAFTSSSFDLKDAKNFFLVSEFCQLLKSVVQKQQDADVGVNRIYEILSSSQWHLTEAECVGVCTRLKEEQRASTQFKAAFRQLLEAAQARRSAT